MFGIVSIFCNLCFSPSRFLFFLQPLFLWKLLHGFHTSISCMVFYGLYIKTIITKITSPILKEMMPFSFLCSSQCWFRNFMGRIWILAWNGNCLGDFRVWSYLFFCARHLYPPARKMVPQCQYPLCKSGSQGTQNSS